MYAAAKHQCDSRIECSNYLSIILCHFHPAIDNQMISHDVPQSYAISQTISPIQLVGICLHYYSLILLFIQSDSSFSLHSFSTFLRKHD
jgi:hypothetical protein